MWAAIEMLGCKSRHGIGPCAAHAFAALSHILSSLNGLVGGGERNGQAGGVGVEQVLSGQQMINDCHK